MAEEANGSVNVTNFSIKMFITVTLTIETVAKEYFPIEELLMGFWNTY